MAAASPVDGVKRLAAPAAATAGLIVESVSVTWAGRRRVLRVVVDLPDDAVGGVPLAAVALASQALSHALDNSEVMGGAPYVLEVSSPGADRCLTERRHWRRARGRLVVVALADGRSLRGRLVEVGDVGAVLDTGPIGWESIRSGRIELEFGRVQSDDENEHVIDEVADDPDPTETDEEGEI